MVNSELDGFGIVDNFARGRAPNPHDVPAGNPGFDLSPHRAGAYFPDLTLPGARISRAPSSPARFYLSSLDHLGLRLDRKYRSTIQGANLLILIVAVIIDVGGLGGGEYHRRRCIELMLPFTGMTARGRAFGLRQSAASRIPCPSGINADNLGASYDSTQSQITFRVYSSRATRVEVYIYAVPSGSPEVAHFALDANPSNHVFSGSIPTATIRAAGITGPVYYGYRAWGPNWPYSSSWTKGSGAGFVSDVDSQGNRFNPNKLLIDPYAREISHDPVNATWTDGTVYASGAANRNRDSGNIAPKSILWVPVSQSVGTKPTRAQKDDVLYEVNLRGLTKNDTSVPAALQGTYAGAALKAPYLASLGVTAVEFEPVQETQNDSNDNIPNSTSGQNYWGYLTLNYFAPDRRYSSNKAPAGPTSEFQAMVSTFHEQGIKVYIDVAYNHTGEGGAWSANDPTTYSIFSWRGLDNPTYYELTSDLQYSYDNTGVGGNYNTYNPVAQNLIVDSLAYWRDTMGVDGFRFDLASVLGNTCTVGCYNFSVTDANTALNRIQRELPPRPAAGGSGVDLYAEPWAIGGNSYQLGSFPAGWSEWNGSYRDTLRQAQNDLGITTITTGQLATRFAGSSDLFGSRSPWNSTNFLDVHDGFTLDDLYRCNGPNNNQPWPYGPSDGGIRRTTVGTRAVRAPISAPLRVWVSPW